MKSIYSLSLAILGLAFGSGLSAQPLVQQQDIEKGGVNLRTGTPVILASSIFTSHPAGTAVVRFDGSCISDAGDRMVMAASHDGDWTINDGHVAIKAPSAAVGRRSFSHTRVYDVPAGTDTFYAVGENVVEQGGSGAASIYGHLTVEFFPAMGSAVPNTNINWSGDLSAGQKRADSLDISAAPLGRVYLHMDGQVYSDSADRIMLTAGNSPSWLVDAGSVACMAAGNSNKYSPFTHSRVFDVTHNPNKYYAMVANVVDHNGSRHATVYGNLSAEFFPSAGLATVDNTNVQCQGLHVRQVPVAVDSLVVNAPYPGQVLVQFDGYITSTVGDRMVLAASDSRSWSPNSGAVGVLALSHDNPFEVFSHSRLYTIAPGSHTYYAVAQNYVDTAGAGTVNIAANLSVKYFPDAGVGVNDVAADKSFRIYPNPAQNNLIILFPKLLDEMQTIEISDMTGRSLLTAEAYGTDQVQINLSSLPAGMYLVRCDGVVRKMIKE